jgi:hypothetical protein
MTIHQNFFQLAETDRNYPEVNMKPMNRWITYITCLAWITAGIGFAGDYGMGNGTAEDPYQIWTAEELDSIGQHPEDFSKHFILMSDIDLSQYDGQDGRPAFHIIAPDTDPREYSFQGTPFTELGRVYHHRYLFRFRICMGMDDRGRINRILQAVHSLGTF